MARGKIVAFIPLRGGSKRIPCKNIKEIAGKPLAYWVIESALGCARIDEVVASIDSDAIGQVIGRIKDGRFRMLRRSPETATDGARTESAMLEFADRSTFEHIVLIQATSPLLRSSHLEEGLQQYFETGCDSLLSVVRQKRFIWKEDGRWVKPMNYDLSARPMTQDFKGFLVENGAFYVTSRERLLLSRCRLSGKTGAYEMPEESYIELDESSDWDIVENYLRSRSI